MTGNMEPGSGRRARRWRIAAWTAAAGLLLLPLIAMQVTDEVNWDQTDFAAMGLLLGVAGLGLELAMRKSGDIAGRVAAGLAIFAAFLLVWVNLAVGALGPEGSTANLMFFGILAVAIIGSSLARFRAAGMASAMLATAAAQCMAGAIAVASGRGPADPDGFYDVVMGTGLFAALWLASAWQFHRAARRQATTAKA